MAYLTSKELDDLRTHYTATLPDTCEVEYVSYSRDGAGRQAESWTSRGSAIACRKAPAATREQAGIEEQQLMEGGEWIFSLPYSQTVALDDKITHGGQEYRVTRVNTAESERFLRRVRATRWT